MFQLRMLLLCAFSLSLPVLSGCSKSQPPEDPALSEKVMTYQGGAITARDFLTATVEFMDRDTVAASAISETQWAQNMLGRIVEAGVIADLARKEGLDKDPVFLNWRQNALSKEIMQVFQKDKVLRGIQITAEEVKKEYEFNQSKYKLPTTFRFNHIWIDPARWGLDEARKRSAFAYARLKSGQEPQIVISEFSDREGDDRFKPMGDYRQGELPYPALEKAALETPLGSFSAVVETPIGLHIVFPVDVQKERPIPLDEVSMDIHNEIFARKTKDENSALFEKYGKKLNVKIHPELLKDPQASPTQEILRVGDTSVKLGEFRDLAKQAKTGMTEEDVLAEVAQRMVFHKEALREKYDQSPEVKRSMAFHDNESLATLYISNRIKELPPLTDADVEEYYKNQSKWFYQGKQIEPYEIFIKFNKRDDMMRYEVILGMQEAKKRVDEVRRKIVEGMPFMEAAKIYSQSTSASIGGAIGKRAMGTGHNFDDVAFSLEEGQVSLPINLDKGYQLVWVPKTYQSYLPTLDEIREEVTTRAKEAQEKEFRQTFEEEMRKNCQPVIDEAAIEKWRKFAEEKARDSEAWAKI